MNDSFTKTDPRIILALLIGFSITFFCIIISKRKEKAQEKRKRSAIEKGNIIKAKRVKIYQHRNTSDSDVTEITYHGRYEYTIDGKTKYYAVHSENGLPSIYLDLYYTNSPHKVFSDYDRVGRVGFGVAVLLGIAACILTMYLTGYFANPS